MKGIILAGDSGNRLHPITLGIPKQLIPIYNRPMVYYPIETLVNAGITEILLITTPEYSSSFKNAIGNYLGAHYSYAIQEKPNGIAEALIIGKDFFDKDGVCLITGDTIITGDGVDSLINKAIRTVTKSGNATMFVENKGYPDQYGKVVIDRSRKIKQIIGSQELNHYYSIAGLYVFPNEVKKYLGSIQESERGLKEIIDVQRIFLEKLKLRIEFLDNKCVWLDTNSFDNILKCGEYMRKRAAGSH